MPHVYFTKQPNGAWSFESPVTGNTYEALHRKDGWALVEVSFHGVSNNQYHELATDLPGRFPTRSAAVKAALAQEVAE